jgi:DNA polymerase lambda
MYFARLMLDIYVSNLLGIMSRLLHALHEAGIITEDLALPEDLHAPEAIYRGLCKLPDTVDNKGKSVRRLRRRIDFLSIPWQNRGAALLYYTVSRSGFDH